MGKKRDEVDPQELRRELLGLADLILRLDDEDGLLEASPELIRMMGNLRARLFEYEVRCTGRLLPQPEDVPEVLEAQRIVEEAARQLEEAEKNWERPWTPDEEEDEDR